MSTNDLKISLVKNILKIEDASLLQKLSELIAGQISQSQSGEAESEWADDFTEEQLKQIKKGIKELDEGKGIPWEEVRQKLRKSQEHHTNQSLEEFDDLRESARESIRISREEIANGKVLTLEEVNQRLQKR